MSEQRPGGIHGIHTIGVPVTDQDRAVRFYVDILGFEKRMDAEIPQLGSRWIEVAPPGSPVSVALVQAHEGLPAGGESGIRFTTDDAAAHTQRSARQAWRSASCSSGPGSRRCSPSGTRTATAWRSCRSGGRPAPHRARGVRDDD